MSRNAMIAIIAGIIAAAAIAGAFAATMSTGGTPTQQNNQTATTASEGKKITIDLNENLGMKENS